MSTTDHHDPISQIANPSDNINKQVLNVNESQDFHNIDSSLSKSFSELKSSLSDPKINQSLQSFPEQINETKEQHRENNHQTVQQNHQTAQQNHEENMEVKGQLNQLEKQSFQPKQQSEKQKVQENNNQSGSQENNQLENNQDKELQPSQSNQIGQNGSQQANQKSQKEEQKDEEKETKTHEDIQKQAENLVSLKIFEQKINQALEFKNKGNQFFKAKDLANAIKQYAEGLRIIDPKDFYGATQAQCKKMAEVSASLLFNIGTCYFNMKIWKNAEVYFTQTLMINQGHIKAIYKRALCFYELQEYEKAMQDIKEAFRMDKSSQQIYSAYEKILSKYNEHIRIQKEKQKEMSQRIFRSNSQKSVSSQNKQNQSKLSASQLTEDQNQNQHSDWWGYVPLVLLSGAALFYAYKKISGK